jgi:hypothetical protein
MEPFKKKPKKIKKIKPTNQSLKLKKTKSGRYLLDPALTNVGGNVPTTLTTHLTQLEPLSDDSPPAVINEVATGMAGSTMALHYAKTVADVEAKWEKLTPKQRIDGLMEAVNVVIGALGMPPLEATPPRFGEGDPDNGLFTKATWTIECGVGFCDFELDHARFSRAAGTIYHEARHAEQFYRVARKLGYEKKNGKDIERIILLTSRIGAQAAAHPLSPDETDEWAQAVEWQRDLERTDAVQSNVDQINDALQIAQATHDEALEDWKQYQYARVGNPLAGPKIVQVLNNMLAQPDGRQQWIDYGAKLNQAYLAAREAFRHVYSAYANTSVELDGWAVGGLVETLLNGTAYTAQEVLDKI